MKIIELEQARTLSLLSDLPHMIDDSKQYVAFKGYIFTYSCFCVLLLWTLCGTNIYSRIWHDNEDNIISLKEMNPHDKNLVNCSDTNVGSYISNKFREMMKNMEPNEIEYMVDNMLAEYIPQH